MAIIGSSQWQPLPMKTFILKHWTLFSITLLAASAIWIWFSRVDPSQASAAETSAPHKGFLAPDFSLSTIEGEVGFTRPTSFNKSVDKLVPAM
jgi:hypothetical protein